jgi:N6-adenosine-specific RNA methylase IME4
LKDLEYHPLANIFPMLSSDELGTLSGDIRDKGQQEPIVLYEGKILDGRNRYQACLSIGVDPSFTEYNGDDPAGYVVSLNLHRRHLTESQRAMVASKLANISQHDFRGNQSVTANLQEPTTRAQAAEMLNVSERTVNTAKRVEKDGAPELSAAVEQGRVSVSAASDIATLPKEEQTQIVAKGEKEILAKAKAIRAEKAKERRDQRREKITQIAKGNADLPQDKKYPVIYADPPWRYQYAETESRAIENQYPTMALDDICGLNVPATDDAVLFLWTTAPKLEEGFRVVREWGFEFKTCAIWDKQKMGMGYYFRVQHEILLIGARGSLPPPEGSDRPRSIFSFPAGEHSAKPPEVAAMIEAMYPSIPKLEMFCRSPRDGWDAWGNQSAT